MDRFAVIAAHNRHDLLRATVAAIGPQVDAVVIVDNASDPPICAAEHLDGDRTWVTTIVLVEEQPPNLARNWNVGIDAALALHEAAAPERRGSSPPLIAVLNDDAPAPAGWFDAVTAAMVATGAVVGCSDPWGTGHAPRVKREPDRSLMERMPGWAWILDPASPVRPDESLRWWWNDTDVDWQARLAGGMVMVGAPAVPNVQPNYWTIHRPDCGARVAADREAFAAKWAAYGGCPW
jgi:hypothetical protein